MEVALEGKGSEITAALYLLKSLDLRDKVVMGMPCTRKEQLPFRL